MGQIVKIGTRHWLLGLDWVSGDQPLSADALHQVAEQLGAQWVVKRATVDTRQTGLAAALPGRSRPGRLYSLAATLAGSFAPPWCGIFDLGEGLWWYLAVGEGHAVLPDGDVVGDRATIEGAQSRHQALASWVVHQGDGDTLQLMLANAKPVPVRSIQGWSLSPWQWAGLAVSLLLVFSVATWWLQYQKTLRQFHEKQQQQRQHLEQSERQNEFFQLPMPESWALDCQRTLESIPLSRYGWAVGTISCQGPSLEVNWEWKEGALLSRRPEGVLSVGGDRVTQTLALEHAPEPGLDNREEIGRAVNALRDWAQAAGLELGFENLTTTPAATVRFRLFSPVMPFGFNFDTLPGMRLQRMTSSNEGWEIQGALYGRP
jgi:hypothetical protein